MHVTVRVGDVALPPTLSTAEAAEILGCSVDYLQRERGAGALPVEPLRLGNRLRWPTAAVAEAVGLPVEVVTEDALADPPVGGSIEGDGT